MSEKLHDDVLHHKNDLEFTDNAFSKLSKQKVKYNKLSETNKKLVEENKKLKAWIKLAQQKFKELEIEI